MLSRNPLMSWFRPGYDRAPIYGTMILSIAHGEVKEIQKRYGRLLS
jgi:hypothetical protein